MSLKDVTTNGFAGALMGGWGELGFGAFGFLGVARVIGAKLKPHSQC